MIDCGSLAQRKGLRALRQPTPIGEMHVSSLDTPALLIDLDRVEANLDRAASYAAEHGLRIRPHTKTHKSPLVARMQLDRGAAGLTVAKVGEAEIMAIEAVPNLLVAYPLWGDTKWERLVEVAKNLPVTVALDSAQVAVGLSRHARRAGIRIGILVEADLGMRRCGLPPGSELVALARSVAAMPSLRLEGVMFYPGHINMAQPTGAEQLEQLQSELAEVLEDFRADGLPTEVVSGGSTPTLFHSHRIEGLTEIRPGTYVFNDRTQVAVGACAWGDCAATILTTVVSTARPDAVVIDGGSKTFSSDPLRPDDDGEFGRVLDMPGARLHKMSEEHGVVDLREHSGSSPRLGQRLRIIPNHVCVTVNMHERAFGLRGDTVQESWVVAARGKLQ